MAKAHRYIVRHDQLITRGVDHGADLGEPLEIVIIFQCAGPAAFVHILRKDHAAVREPAHVIAADDAVAHGVAGHPLEHGRRFGDQFHDQTAIKFHILAGVIDARAGLFPDVQRFSIHKDDADIFQNMQRRFVNLFDLRWCDHLQWGPRVLHIAKGNMAQGGNGAALAAGGAPVGGSDGCHKFSELIICLSLCNCGL